MAIFHLETIKRWLPAWLVDQLLHGLDPAETSTNHDEPSRFIRGFTSLDSRTNQLGSLNLEAATLRTAVASSITNDAGWSDPVLSNPSSSGWRAGAALAQAAEAPAKMLATATVSAPGNSVQGFSQSQLADAWWQTVYSISAADHFGLFDDASDPRGRRGSAEKALQGQFSPGLLFAGGAFGPLTQTPESDGVFRIARTIVLPGNSRTTVFFPILNGLFDNLVNDPEDPNNLTGNKTAGDLQALAAGLFAASDSGGLVSSLFASVDGSLLSNPYQYRQASEAAFSYTTQYPVENSLLAAAGYSDASFLDNAGEQPIQLSELRKGKTLTISPAVSDGYWLAVDLDGGSHQLRFGGSLGDAADPFFSLDVSYSVLSRIDGSNGADTLTGLSGHHYLDGGEGQDILIAGWGDDVLVGGNGRDVLDGGGGSDELWGDAGRDTFVFRKGYGHDSIFDFSKSESVLLSGFDSNPIIQEAMLPSGMSASQLDFGDGDRLTLVGVSSANLRIQAGILTML